MAKTAGTARTGVRVGADRDKVAANPHRGQAAGRLVRPLDKLVQVAGRAVAQLANRQVVQVVVLLCRLRRNTVPVVAVVDGQSSH